MSAAIEIVPAEGNLDSIPPANAPAVEAAPPAIPLAAEPVAEPAAIAGAELAGPATPAPEPVMIDVWRPRRRRELDARAAGAAPGDRPPHRGRKPHFRNGKRPEAPSPISAAPTPPVAAGADTPPAAVSEHRQGARHENGRKPGGDHRKPGSNGPERRDHRRPFDKPPRHRERDRDERGGRPQVISAAPSKKRGPDPDSPFAALGQLKAALEEKAKK